jgi:hypothetical protein
MGLAAGSSGLGVRAIVPAHQLLAALVDVLPTGAAADAEEMTDRDCPVATSVNGAGFRPAGVHHRDGWDVHTTLVGAPCYQSAINGRMNA